MSEYNLSYYGDEASRLAVEIERKLAILGIDWKDETALRRIAKQALADHESAAWPVEEQRAAWTELFGLIGLMNTVMAESAGKDFETHGNEAWKALARALWAERQLGV